MRGSSAGFPAGGGGRGEDSMDLDQELVAGQEASEQGIEEACGHGLAEAKTGRFRNILGPGAVRSSRVLRRDASAWHALGRSAPCFIRGRKGDNAGPRWSDPSKTTRHAPCMAALVAFGRLSGILQAACGRAL